MALQQVNVPDIGGAEGVDVIEISVAVGDMVEKEDSIVVLESDKASMEIPSPMAGKIASIKLKEGDKVSEGDAILELETDSADKNTGDNTPTVNTPEEKDKAPKMAQNENSSQAQAAPVNVPDIGGAEGVDVIEISVAPGDEVEEGDSLIVLESDKASMEIPSPRAGKVASISLKEGDKVSEGDEILILQSSVDGAAQSSPPPAETKGENKTVGDASSENIEETIEVPDIGGSENVDVIEVTVSSGDSVEEGDSLIVLESDKASMEIPSPLSGEVISLAVKEGDKVSQGSAILVLKTAAGLSAGSEKNTGDEKSDSASTTSNTQTGLPRSAISSSGKPLRSNEMHPQVSAAAGSSNYAGPATRKLARQLGVQLSQVAPSGPRGRIVKDDVKAFVKKVMENGGAQLTPGGTAGAGIPPIPAVDFTQFGEVELVKMSKIKKITATNMSRNWLNVPHVTQFDDVDISKLEVFRKDMKAEAEKGGVKLTPVPFIIKACAAALKAEPSFNVSLHEDGEHIVQKKYINIGMAVDTPAGLMVPVIKDVDKKGIYDIAKEVIELASKAREGKLKPYEMQGGCFTISSLGPIGGTGFTPIVNAPEVAILGVSKASIKPHWNGSEFEARQFLPLSLSYDHRAINGGDAGRFFTYLASVLSDVRRLLL